MTIDRKIPVCIGIIMDGNRRWAKEKGLLSFEGHREGAERLREVAYWVRDRGIKHLVVYAFSKDNWNRTAEEVSYLLNLFQSTIDKLSAKIVEENIRVKFVGEREHFEKNIQEAMTNLENMTSKNEALTLWVCVSYNGRAEIARATSKAIKSAGGNTEITEEMISQNLWTSGMPDPDIIIRTGHEKRLSGFLAWQSIYSELFFLDEYWPDFSEEILDRVLNEYNERERRMGK
ncbi:MAG: polyprenyl diphosphate synthase [Candidatus Paceibacterota bacterium]